MLIEYYATPEEDDKLFEWIDKLNIKYTEAFNPEDYYYVIECDDDRIVTVMTLLDMEIYISGSVIRNAKAELK